MPYVRGTHVDLDWLCVMPLWLICAIWATILMRQRGHATWKGLLLGLALGPMGVLWTLTVPRADRAGPFPEESETPFCRSCGRPVSPRTLVCPHCGHQHPAGQSAG